MNPIPTTALPGLVVYSSKTGNTRYLAEGVCAALGGAAELARVEDEPSPDGRPWLALAFWVDRGTADAKTLAYLNGLSGRRICLLGTIGAYPDSAHAVDVRRRTTALAAERNQVLGVFLCQGRIDPKLVEAFKKLPPDHPHAMNDERRKRHADAASHPNEDDVAAAAAALRAMLGQGNGRA